MNYRTIPFDTWKKRNPNTNPVYHITKNMTIAEIERFCSKIERTNKCWNFKTKTNELYIRFNSKMLAHRVAYELFIGPIPNGLTLDHLCFNTHCVNPLHLEPVTVSENSKRAVNRYSV